MKSEKSEEERTKGLLFQPGFCASNADVAVLIETTGSAPLFDSVLQ